MDAPFLSNDWINYVLTNYSMLIDYIKWVAGTPIGVYVIGKLIAIMNINTPDNKVMSLIKNTIGKKV